MDGMILLTLLLIKHFWADWFFQSSEMAAKKGSSWLWLSAHCGIHIFLSAPLLLFFTSVGTTVLLLILEFVLHFLIDWTKSRPILSRLYPMPTHNFWVLIGLDQLAHQLFYVAVTFIVVSGYGL